jgi:hypothetical protein
MSPRESRNDIWVSDEESEEEQEVSSQQKKPSMIPFWKKQGRKPLWHERLKQLTRVGMRGNTRPPVGQLCLVMTGKVDQDQGQVGIVTRQTSCMVEIAIRPTVGDLSMTVLKRPSSLIMLGPGLILIQEKNGSVWIRHDPDET